MFYHYVEYLEYEREVRNMCTTSNTAGRIHRLPEIEVFRPKTVQEAIELLAQHPEDAKVLAGGTDIMNKMKRRTLVPKYLVSLNNIDGLDSITYENDELHIGARVTYSKIVANEIIQEKYPIIAQAAALTASAPVRSAGTLMGNICNAVPSADSAPPLLVLGGKVQVVGPKGFRTVPMEDFILCPHKCCLAADEIATEVIVPAPEGKAEYQKMQLRNEGDLAMVGVAVRYLPAADGETCEVLRVGLGAVGPTPLRAKTAEAAMEGKKVTPELIEQVAALAMDDASCIDDIRATAEYRREVIRVFMIRALSKLTGVQASA